MIKLKDLILETRIIDPEASLWTGDITLYHGTNWDVALKAKKGQLRPQPLKQYVVDILVKEFGETPEFANNFFEKYSIYRKNEPSVLYLTTSFRHAKSYAISNTKWGGEIVTDILYNYILKKYKKRDKAAEFARKWIEQHRTEQPAVVTVTVPLSMVFTHPNWKTPARKRILNLAKNIKRMGYVYSDKEEMLEDFAIEVFVYEPIPAKYVQRIDRV